MSRRRNETGDPSDPIRLAQSPANDEGTASVGVIMSGSVCLPAQGTAGGVECGYLRPLSKVRGQRLIIGDTLGRVVGEPEFERCTLVSRSNSGFSEGGSAMIGASFIYASAEQEPDDHDEDGDNKAKPRNMSMTGPSTKRNSENPYPEADEVTEPSESGERVVSGQQRAEQVALSREEIDLSLSFDADAENKALFTPVPASVVPLGNYDTLSPPKYENKVEVEEELLSQMAELLREGTLESHGKAMELMKGSGLLAVQRWEPIHSDPDSKHNFSRVSKRRVNSFARFIHNRVELGENSVILELGSGFGNDATHFARNSEAQIIGVDSSQTAITEAQTTLGRQGLRDRVHLTCHDFLEVLEQSRGMNLDMVYSHSTLHYSSPLILRERTFPLIADVLRANHISGRSGKLCFAMKTGASASAKSPNQRRLVPGDPYNPSVDMQDKVFRIYPESKADILALLAPSFDVEYARVVPVRGYDKNGDTEMFCYVIATPKTTEKSA